MRSGKTRRGVTVTRTVGMRESKPEKTWIVVLDPGRAVFLARNDADRSVSVVHQIEDPEGRARGRKRGSTLSGSRPVSSSEVSPHEEARHRLNHGVARFLDRAQEAGTVSYLVLIGEPGVLGDVRNDLNAKVRKMIIREIHRDWTHRKGEGLLRQAAQVFEEHR